MAGAQASIRNFIAPLKGPGRTAPSLLEDITLYDPRYPAQPGRNLLQDPPYNFIDTPWIKQLLPPDSCQHDYRIQRRQSCVPKFDERPSPVSVYQVAAVCLKCRIHLLVKIDYTAAWKDHPCPNHDYPLHHLVRSNWRQDAANRDLLAESADQTDVIYVYECSSESCSAIVTVRLSPPILPDDAVYLLTDPVLLQERTDAAFEAHKGQTEGMRRPTPLEVLADLRGYIKNAWKENPQAEINIGNRRFAVRFGPGGAACREVLTLLRFTERPGHSWQVPLPYTSEIFPLQSLRNVFLDNAEAELDVLVMGRSQEERMAAQDATRLDPADFELSRILACQNYDQVLSAGMGRKNPANRGRSFTMLGIPDDASDELVLFGYKRQISLNLNDTRLVATLMSSLEDIRNQRRSEILATQVGIEQSMGRHTLETIQDAHRSLGLPSDTHTVSDEDVVNYFSSRVPDVGPQQEQMLREALYIVGQYRQSQKIMNFARNTMDTYEDALSFLGAESGTGDDFIRSLYTNKVSDEPLLVDMAKKAVKLIAERRDSKQLREFITSGYESAIQEADMDVGEAFNLLGIEDRTVDDAETLYAIFLSRQEDDPANESRLRKAIETIANFTDSAGLKSFLGMPMNAEERPKPTYDEPVGLDNIGNTCYLNSLLQWLFTVLPLRDIVLDFDTYRMEATFENMAKKKVGHRQISRREVDTAQRFALSLANLFRQMITSSQRAIKPDQELARLTLETDFVKTGRRSSTLQSGRRPTLGSIDSRPIFGPLPQPDAHAEAILEEPVLSPMPVDSLSPETANKTLILEPQSEIHGQTTDSTLSQDGDNSSEITLVSKPPSEEYEEVELTSKDQQQAILDNKENYSPTKEDEPSASEFRDDHTIQPLRAASPSKLNVQAGALEAKQHASSTARMNNDSNPIIYQPPPGPPPPIPPRRPVQTSTSTLEEYARQQDVPEVMSHAIFQLSCAMRPLGHAPDGEQLDEIHDTFYGESRIHTIKPSPEPASPVQFLSVQAGIWNHPKDIYAALDNEYDLYFREDGSEVYSSVTKLPPVLTISLGRVIFDETSKAQIKLNDHVELPTTIYMDRYMDAPADSSLMARRKHAWGLKRELKSLKERKAQLESSTSEPLDQLFLRSKLVLEHLILAEDTEPGFLSDLSVPRDDLVGDLNNLSIKCHNEIKKVNSRIIDFQRQIDDSFTDSSFRNLEYKLHAAFFHRGTVGSGHYWVYIYDHVGEQWRKYNDDRVSIVQNLNEIFADPSKDTSNPNYGRPTANPYFLVYVRSSEIKDGIVETVKRNVVIPPEIHQESYQETNPSNGKVTGDTMLRPLGVEDDDDKWATSSHHEWAGRPSQMSTLPPGSMMRQPNGQQNTPPSEAMSAIAELDAASKSNVEQMRLDTYQPVQPGVQKIGNWDDSSADVDPRKF